MEQVRTTKPRLPKRRSQTKSRFSYSRIDLHGVAVDVVTEAQAAERVVAGLRAGFGGWVITPNLDHLRRARKDDDFRAMLGEADLVVADGMPLVWASRLQRTPLPERVAGSSLVSTLAGRAAEGCFSIFLLGGSPDSAEAAADALRDQSPRLTIAGTYCPPWGFEDDAAEWERVVRAVTEARPDIVYVALGSPKQERVIHRLRRESPDLRGAWWLGVGISLSFLSGDVARAPRWAQRLGLEWLHRLKQEPRRLARRYLVEGVPFAAVLLTTSATKGARSFFIDTPAPNP